MTAFHDMTVAALAADLQAKKVSATEVAQHFLACLLYTSDAADE